MHSDILNYTKLAFNSLKMIQNDTVYQPIKQGMISRMLRRMCVETIYDRDRYIDPVMFAYREAPQQSTRFSPFELLNGRNVRGPMSILSEL